MTTTTTNPAFELSIIIPTFNEASVIAQTLDSIAKIPEAVEVIVVDGGSDDGTVRIARERSARVLMSERGRGVQMHAGARAARGRVLWFLHADTVPQHDAFEIIAQSLRNPHVVGGSFNVDFDSRQLSARFLSWFYRQIRDLGLSYGDSAIFVRREAYEEVGGFKPLPIFEDLDFVRRLNSEGRFAHLHAGVTTSSRRFKGRSFALTFARWTLLQILYWIGVNPRALGGFYVPIRNSKL